MVLILPDIVRDLAGLSLGPLVVGVALGLSLLLLGWKSHRFWMVLVATVLAGVVGLYEISAQKGQPLIASMLLALAAGLLALALVRLFAFVAGGIAGLVVVQSLAPGLDQPLIAFLVTGLVGLLLFRYCVMLITSVLGSTILCYAAMALIHRQGRFDMAAWLEQSTSLANGILWLVTTLGFLTQLYLNRLGKSKKKDSGSSKKKKKDEEISDPWTRMMRKAS
jgi:MFS family permease